MELKIPSNEETRMSKLIYALKSGSDISVFLQDFDYIITELSTKLKYHDEKYEVQFINETFPLIIDIFLNMYNQSKERYKLILRSLCNSLAIFRYMMYRDVFSLKKVFEKIMNKESKFYLQDDSSYKSVVHVFISSNMIPESIERINLTPPPSMQHLEIIAESLFRLKHYLTPQKFNEELGMFLAAIRNFPFPVSFKETSMFFQLLSYLDNSGPGIYVALEATRRIMLSNYIEGMRLYELLVDFTKRDSFIEYIKTSDLHKIYLATKFHINDCPKTFQYLLAANVFSSDDLAVIFTENDISYLSMVTKEKALEILTRLPPRKTLELLKYETQFSKELVQITVGYPPEMLKCEIIVAKPLETSFYESLQNRIIQYREYSLFDCLVINHCPIFTEKFIELIVNEFKTNESVKRFLTSFFEATTMEMPSQFISLFLDHNLFNVLNKHLKYAKIHAFDPDGFNFINNYIQTCKYTTATKDQIQFIVDFILMNSQRLGEITPDFAVKTFPISNINILIHAYQVTPPEISAVPHDTLLRILCLEKSKAFDMLFFFLNQSTKPYLRLRLLTLIRDTILEIEKSINITDYDVYRFCDAVPNFYIMVRIPNGYIIKVYCSPDSTFQQLADKIQTMTGLTVTEFITDFRKTNPNNSKLSEFYIKNQSSINAEVVGNYVQPFIPSGHLAQKDFHSTLFELSAIPDLYQICWELLMLLPISTKISSESIVSNLDQDISPPFAKYLLKCALNWHIHVVPQATKYISNSFVVNEALDCIMAYPQEFDIKNMNLLFKVIENERCPHIIAAICKLHPDINTNGLTDIICSSLISDSKWNVIKIIPMTLPLMSDSIVSRAASLLDEGFSQPSIEAITLLWQSASAKVLPHACSSLMKHNLPECVTTVSQILTSGRIQLSDAEYFIDQFLCKGVTTLQESYFMTAQQIAEYHGSQKFNDFLQSISEYKVTEWNYDPKTVKRTKILTGLKNLGATCYLNAVIQQIVNLPQLFADVNEFLPQCQWAVSFQKLLREMKYSNRPFIDTEEFVSEFDGFGLKINPHEQQDAAEFLLAILNALPIQKRFMTKLYENNKESNFLIVPVQLEGECLNLDNIRVIEEPQILCIQLSRFAYSHQTRERVKINNRYPFMPDTNFGRKHYTLKGVINHIGTPNHGHYVSLVKKDGKWVKINDTDSSYIDDDVAMLECFGESVDDESAYLLFYVLDGFDDRRTNVSPEIASQIDVDNRKYAQQLLAFEDFCFNMMPKAPYGTLISFFANIYIHSRKTSHVTQFRTAIFNKLSAEKTAIFTLNVFMENVEHAFANISSPEIAKLLQDVIITCFSLAGVDASLDFATSILYTFAATAGQWRQASYMLSIIDSFLKMPGSILLAQQKDWASCLATICALALSPERSQTFLENCDISQVFIALNACATPKTDAKCLRSIIPTIGMSPKSIASFYHSVEHLCAISAIPLAEALAYFSDGHTIDRKQSLIYSKIVHCMTRADVEKLYMEAGGIEVSRAAIINQLMKYSASPNIHQTIFAKFGIICISGLISDDKDERAAAKNLIEVVCNPQTVSMMNETLMQLQKPSTDYLRCLIICTKKVIDPSTPLPMILEPFLQFLTIDNLRFHREELLLMLCYSDERIDGAFYSIFKGILDLDRQSFQYAVGYLPFISPRVVGALLMLDGWRECARTLKDPSTFIDFLRGTNCVRAFQIAAAVALERRDTQRLSLLAQYIPDNEIQDAAIVAVQANAWSIITQLANGLKNFRIPPQVAANIALQDSHAMALYCEMRDKQQVVAELQRMSDVGGSASAAIADIDPVEGLNILKSSKEPATSKILEVLALKDIGLAASDIAVRFFMQQIDQPRRAFCTRILKTPGVDYSKFISKIQFNSPDDIPRVAIILDANPGMAEPMANYIRQMMSQDWYKAAPPNYANDKRVIDSTMMTLYMKNNANKADALFSKH